MCQIHRYHNRGQTIKKPGESNGRRERENTPPMVDQTRDNKKRRGFIKVWLFYRSSPRRRSGDASGEASLVAATVAREDIVTSGTETSEAPTSWRLNEMPPRRPFDVTPKRWHVARCLVPFWMEYLLDAYIGNNLWTRFLEEKIFYCPHKNLIKLGLITPSFVMLFNLLIP